MAEHLPITHETVTQKANHVKIADGGHIEVSIDRGRATQLTLCAQTFYTEKCEKNHLYVNELPSLRYLIIVTLEN